MITVNSSRLFSTVYNKVFRSIMAHEKERYTFTGGRASCKSSFISICIVILIVMNPEYNALIIRKTANTLRRSVFEQIVWAINILGLSCKFKIPRSSTAALPIVYTRKDGRTQSIIFAGSDDTEKIKSIKVATGYFAILWIEEKTEFSERDLQNIRISALRGGHTFFIFESYNPPSAVRHWCNAEARTFDKNREIVHTTYLDIPSSWLGEAILHDIEHTKETNDRAYRNIYLGEATGTGLNIFENIELREITNEEINNFECFYYGIDWGYSPDPFMWVEMAYDARHATLYILDEMRLIKHGNLQAHEALKEKLKKKYPDAKRYESFDKGVTYDFMNDRIRADTDNKDIADFRAYGWNILPAEKGIFRGKKGRDVGFKWLQSLDRIVIDTARCPYAADEFSLYEYQIDKKTGEVLSGYPEGQPDHAIAAVRYAMADVYRYAGE